MLSKDLTILTLNKKNITDFAHERNSLLATVTTDWVLFLDSDEKLDHRAEEKINQVIAENKLDGVFLKREDYFYSKKLRFGETGNTWLLRLAKTKKMKFARPVHEVAVVNGKVGKKNIIIKHYAHQSVTEFFTKVIGYAKIEGQLRSSLPEINNTLVILQLATFPVGKFIFNFIIKLGFLDSWQGLIYATMMSLHSLMVRVFVIENKIKKLHYSTSISREE